MTCYRRLGNPGVFCTLLAAVLAAGCAATDAPQAAAPELDSQVAQIMKPMCEALDKAGAMRFRVEATVERPLENGRLVQFHRTTEVTAVRPDRLYATTESEEGNWAIWQRGGQVSLLNRSSNIYATETVPANIGRMLDQLVDEYDLVLPMADLLAGETYPSLTAEVESAEYLGVRMVHDARCHHLLFRQAEIDWQIWIQADGQPLPRKLVITYRDEPDEPEYAAVIDRWELTPAISGGLFTFSPPAGATAVSMLDLLDASEED